MATQERVTDGTPPPPLDATAQPLDATAPPLDATAPPLDATRSGATDGAPIEDQGSRPQDWAPDEATVDSRPPYPLDSSVAADALVADAEAESDMQRPSPPPHQALVFDVEPAVLAAALSRRSECVQYDYSGGRGFEGSGACHTQGVARTRDALITSCQDREENIGFLQVYQGGPRDYGRQSPQSAEWVPLHGRPSSHAVVGQGLPDTNLVVVVSSDSRDAPARVEVRDDDGLVCGFEHVPPARPEDRDLHLGAASLTVHNGQVHLVACSWDCDRLYLYRLDLAEADCAPRRIIELDVARDGQRREDGGAGDDNWGPYNGISAFGGTQGRIYLLASHGEWLDTWLMTRFGDPAMTLHKVAKHRWGRNPAAHGGRGLFYEGMSIERRDALTMRIWAAPHDYGRDGCGPDRACVRALYSCDIDLR